MGVDYEAVNNVELAANGAPAEHITDLSAMPESSKEAILKADEVKHRLLDKSKGVEGVNQEKLLKLAEDIEFTQSQLEILSQALIESCKELPAEIENLPDDKKKKLHTTYEDKTGPQYESETKNLDEDMRLSVFKIFSRLLPVAKYPVILAGSSPFKQIAGDKTIKVPDDKDIISAGPNLPDFYKVLKEMENEKEIVDLKIVTLTDLDGKPDGNHDIQGKVKVGGQRGFVDFSIFFPTIDPRVPPNGFLNVGRDELTADVRRIQNPENEKEFVDVPFASKETTELLYIKNVLREIALFKFHKYKKGKEEFPWLTPKALQRLSSLAIMNNHDFDQIMAMLDKGVEDLNRDELEGAKEFLLELRGKYKNTNSNGEGLSKSLCGEETKSEHCVEVAVNKITSEIKKEMNEALDQATRAEKIFNGENEYANLTPEAKMERINKIFGELSVVYNKYHGNLLKINNKNDDDFVPFTAMSALEEHFLSPIFDNLLYYEAQLKKQ